MSGHWGAVLYCVSEHSHEIQECGGKTVRGRIQETRRLVTGDRWPKRQRFVYQANLPSRPILLATSRRKLNKNWKLKRYVRKGGFENEAIKLKESHETKRDTTSVNTLDLTIHLLVVYSVVTHAQLENNKKKEPYFRALRFDARAHNLSTITKEGNEPFEMSRPISSKP